MGGGGPPPAQAACACPGQEAAELRAALRELTAEVARLRDVLGGPFDGVNGLRREAEGLKREVEGLRGGMRDLTRAVESARR